MFGILFDEMGKRQKFVTLTESNEQPCIPYYISNEKSLHVYYVPTDSSSVESLLQTRTRVLTALIQTLEQQNLLTGHERVTTKLEPNKSEFETQEAIVIDNVLRLRQSFIIDALKNITVDGAQDVFAVLQRSGSPVYDPFNPESNGTCTELK